MKNERGLGERKKIQIGEGRKWIGNREGGEEKTIKIMVHESKRREKVRIIGSKEKR